MPFDVNGTRARLPHQFGATEDIDRQRSRPMSSSRQNRKILTALLAIVVAAALLAVYVLYGKSRHEQPNEAPEAPAQSS
jgi:hypothetical protein